MHYLYFKHNGLLCGGVLKLFVHSLNELRILEQLIQQSAQYGINFGHEECRKMFHIS